MTKRSRKYFPIFPLTARHITIRNLLNHTGGLPDYEDLMDAAEKTRGPIWSPEHQIQDSEVLPLLEKRIERQICSRHQLGLQQFRLRRSRPNRRQSFRTTLCRFSPRPHLRAYAHGSHHRLSKRKK